MLSEERKELLLIIVFAIVGAGVSALSFFLYHYCSHILITIAVCIVDIIYAYFNAKLFLKSKDWSGARKIFIPLMLLVYWTVVFAVIIIGNAMLLKGEFSNHFFLYPIFLMPSFVLIITLLLLLGMGL